MRLTKHHGLGNDFLVVLEADNGPLRPDPEMARLVCDRRRGIGADGLIYGLAGLDGDLSMVLFNADGSPAEISGNGIRCLAQAFLAHYGRRAGELSINTPAGMRSVTVRPGPGDSDAEVRVEMGSTSPGPALTEAAEAYPARERATLDLGNPHLVLWVEDPDAVDVARDGALLEAGFPAGINIEFITPVDRTHLRLRVWERGAGVTEACGSGACAGAVAARYWGLVEPRVTVEMPGGRVVVDVADEVVLTGPAHRIARIEIP